ncbi:hypothetical protein N0V95_009067 [Ascochyta clinopodiicola]|nr:hypothetical protein N0V95_009067 [Ascochyta clinopodiicola]
MPVGSLNQEEDKPLTDYIHKIKERGAITKQWDIPIPLGCLPHIAPELLDLKGGQLFEAFILVTNTRVWACPSSCGYSDGILEPNVTSGFPHVECPGCHGRFCANCKVNWHTDQTCQQYRAGHPEVRDKDEEKQLREMARLGARRCPRCQFVIIKDGGCDHVFCEQCHFDFTWPKAEIVTAPVETYVPAASHASGSTFRGWAQLRQAQEDHINRNRIDDTPFNISDSDSNRSHTQPDNGIFYYDIDIAAWSPQVCELEAIAGREAGKRFIRHPSLDRDGLWAFIEVDREHEGGVDLFEALTLESQRLTANLRGWEMPDELADLPRPDATDIEGFEDIFNEFTAPPPQEENGEGVDVGAHFLFGGFGFGVAMQTTAGGPGAHFTPMDAVDFEEVIDLMLGLRAG